MLELNVLYFKVLISIK